MLLTGATGAADSGVLQACLERPADGKISVYQGNVQGKNNVCLIEKTDNPNDSSRLSPTWVTSRQLAQRLGLSVAAISVR